LFPDDTVATPLLNVIVVPVPKTTVVPVLSFTAGICPPDA